MYHLGLFLPLAGLAAFWVLPLFPALLVYLTVVAISVFVCAAVFKAHRREVTTGAEALIGARALVVRAQSDRILVRVEGALWSSDAVWYRDLPRPGDSVVVVGLVGNRLRTMPLNASVQLARSDQLGDGPARRDAHGEDAG